MKKVYLILTLFITSFFFISVTEVKANTYAYTVNETELTYLEKENFLTLRDLTIQHCEANNLKYIIGCSASSCYSHVFTQDKVPTIGFVINGNMKFPKLNYKTVTIYYLKSNKFTEWTYGLTYNYFVKSGESALTYESYIDTNVENFAFGTHEYDITVGDYTYHVGVGEHFPSLYELNESMKEPPDKFIDDKEVINNFYTTVIEKINTLSEIILNNYVFLLIIGIFILIFVLELIMRRFL